MENPTYFMMNSSLRWVKPAKRFERILGEKNRMCTRLEASRRLADNTIDKK